MKKSSFLIVYLMVCFEVSANPLGKGELHITADHQIVCDQKENMCLAEGKAFAQKGALTVRGDILKVFFESPSGPSDGITTQRKPIRLEVRGHAHITHEGYMSHSTDAVYDLVTGLITLSGSPRMQTKSMTLSTQGPLQIFEKEGRGVAHNAVFHEKEKNYRMRSNKLIVYFDESSKNIHRIRTAEGVGDVLITSPTRTIKAAKALYDVNSNTVTLRKNVVAVQGKNIMKGDYAIADLTKEEVRILAEDPTNQRSQANLRKIPHRVKAIFVLKDLQSSLATAKAK